MMGSIYLFQVMQIPHRILVDQQDPVLLMQNLLFDYFHALIMISSRMEQ